MAKIRNYVLVLGFLVFLGGINYYVWSKQAIKKTQVNLIIQKNQQALSKNSSLNQNNDQLRSSLAYLQDLNDGDVVLPEDDFESLAPNETFFLLPEKNNSNKKTTMIAPNINQSLNKSSVLQLESLE